MLAQKHGACCLLACMPPSAYADVLPSGMRALRGARDGLAINDNARRSSTSERIAGAVTSGSANGRQRRRRPTSAPASAVRHAVHEVPWLRAMQRTGGGASGALGLARTLGLVDTDVALGADADAEAVEDAVAEARAITIPVLVITRCMFDVVERYHRTRPAQHRVQARAQPRGGQDVRRCQRQRGAVAMPRASVLWEEPDRDLAAAAIQSMWRGTALRERMRAVGVYEPHPPCRFAGAGTAPPRLQAGMKRAGRAHRDQYSAWYSGGARGSRQRAGRAGGGWSRGRTRRAPPVRMRAKPKTVTSMCACDHIAATRMPRRR